VNLSGRVVLEEPVRVYASAILNDVRIAAFSYVSPQCALHSVDIGRYCSIGDHVRILSMHPTGGLTTSPFPYQTVFSKPFDAAPVQSFGNLLPTRIGHDVWIGSGVQIKSGVHIGNGAIIGAGSVITRDVPAYGVMVGVPARKLRSRFSPELQARAEALAWWRYNLVGLDLNWFGDPNECLEAIKVKVQAGLLPVHKSKWMVLRREGELIVAVPESADNSSVL
jgi:acetyltransferase-like isoleucine patch superfamily enzyme